jgi:hypothetical protein
VGQSFSFIGARTQSEGDAPPKRLSEGCISVPTPPLVHRLPLSVTPVPLNDEQLFAARV